MGATFDDAKRAYRDLVSVWHPDRVSIKNPRLRKKAEARLKEINSAYQALTSYYHSAGRMPYPSKASGSEGSVDTTGVPTTAPSRKLRRWFPIIVVLALSMSAASGYFFYQSLRKVYTGHRLAREIREQSEKRMQELEKKLSADDYAVDIPSDRKAEAVDPHRPLKIIIVDSPKKEGISHGDGPERKSYDRLAAIDDLIHQADAFLAAGRYPEAKAAYESALEIVGNTEGSLPPDLLLRRRAIEKGMARDEIIYGARGYVYYQNRWVPPDIYNREFVTYRGQRRHFKEMMMPLTRAADAAVYATLSRRYPGQVIHKKQVACLKLELLENSHAAARFRAIYRWEVWTFNALDNGRLSVSATYLPETDQWRIGEIDDD